MKQRRPFAAALLLPVIAIFALAFFAGCNNAPKTFDTSVEPITYEDFKDRFRIARDEGKEKELVIVDVRSRDLYVDGHIPGAINIPLPEMTAADPRLNDAKHIVVYGHDYEDMLGIAGAKKLVALGYEGVRHYRDGFEDWAKNQRLGF